MRTTVLLGGILLLLILLTSVPLNVTHSRVNIQSLPDNHSTNEYTRALTDSPWPCYKGNQQRTSLSKFDTSNNPGKVRWKYRLEGQITTQPVIGLNNTIYMATFSKYDEHYQEIFSMNALDSNGDLKWKYEIKSDYISSTPAVDSEGTIYFGDRNNNVYAINPNGDLKWKIQLSQKSPPICVVSSPIIDDDGIIYIGSGDSNLYAICPNGTIKWSFWTGNNISSSPALDHDGMIIIGGDDHSIYRIFPNGTERDRYNVGRNIVSTPTIGLDNTIYILTSFERFYSISSNYSRNWNGSLELTFDSPAISSKEIIYATNTIGSGIVAFNPDGKIHSFHYSAGAKSFQGSPSISSEGTIYFTKKAGEAGEYTYLYAVYSSGSLKWKCKLGYSEGPRMAVIGFDGTIYVACDEYLYAIGKPLHNDKGIPCIDINGLFVLIALIMIILRIRNEKGLLK